MASRVVLCVAAVLMLFSSITFSRQVSSGVLLGAITDSTGAAIPGVTVTATNEGTQLRREIVSNEIGNYRIDLLQPGLYTVSAELPGFKREVRTRLNIDVGQQLRMDFTLQVGQVTEVVEAIATAPVVQTEDSQVGQVIEERKIVDLPLNGRNFSQLAYISPGTFAPRPGSYLGDRGGFVAVGQRESTSQYLLDGVNNTGAGTFEIAARVNIDTIAEFKIQTQNYSAQYGRFAGAQVDAITKSGSNQLHGSMFAFSRNSAFDARNFFEKEKSQFRRHQYGGTIGGPILKNRLFFFAGFQGQRQAQFRATNPTVPFLEFWRGDFSRLGRPVRDPNTGNPFPGAVIPSNRISPIALNFRPYWPEPHNDRLTNNAFALLPEPDNFYQPNAKINYNPSDKHQIIGSWNYYNDSALEWIIAGSPQVPGFMMDGRIQNWTVSLADIMTLSARTINEFRAGYSRVGRIRYPQFRDKNYAKEVGILGTNGDTDPAGWGLPRINVTGYAQIGAPNTQPRKDGSWSLSDSISTQIGRHALRFGGDVYRQYMFLILLSNMSGNFTFTGSATGVPFADFVLGLADTSVRSPLLGPGSEYLGRWSTNSFVQDDWKVTNNLTINMGLRYELNGSMTEKYGKLSSFDPTLGGGRGGIRTVGSGERFNPAVQRYQELYPGLTISRPDQPFYKPDRNNLAPRLGFAYRIGGGTTSAVRGGYGLFYNIDQLCFCSYYTQAPFTLSQQFTRANGITLENPWPATGGVGGTISVAGVDPDYRSGYYQQWNLGIQHELPGAVVLDVSYIGKKGTKLDRTRDINQPLDRSTRVRPYPLFSTVNWLETSGNSNYHGLQLRVERRSSTGPTILTSYAFGKMLDDLGPAPLNSTLPPQDSYNLRRERGRGQEDMRHRLTASYIYPLPLGKGHRLLNEPGNVLGYVFGNWELSGIWRANSGIPLTPTISQDISGTGNRRDRPNLIGNAKLDNPSPSTGWFNRSAFTLPAPGTFGNVGKGVLTGPGYFGVDASLLKRIAVSEGKGLQLRFEFFNILNHPNFNVPNMQFDSASFGTIATAESARQLQGGLKFIF